MLSLKQLKQKNNYIPNFIWCGYSLPAPVREFKFHPLRKWRFDYCFPDKKIAIEIEGGVFSGGRHTRGIGYVRDMEKYNAATLHGWKLLRYTPQNIDFAQILELYVQDAF